MQISHILIFTDCLSQLMLSLFHIWKDILEHFMGDLYNYVITYVMCHLQPTYICYTFNSF
jgi:hypothetical protein